MILQCWIFSSLTGHLSFKFHLSWSSYKFDQMLISITNQGNDFQYESFKTVFKFELWLIWWLYLLGNCLTFSWQHYLVQGFQNKGVQDVSHPLLEGFALHSSYQNVYWYQCNHDLIFLKKFKKLNSTGIICPLKRWSYVPFKIKSQNVLVKCSDILSDHNNGQAYGKCGWTMSHNRLLFLALISFQQVLLE